MTGRDLYTQTFRLKFWRGRIRFLKEDQVDDKQEGPSESAWGRIIWPNAQDSGCVQQNNQSRRQFQMHLQFYAVCRLFIFKFTSHYFFQNVFHHINVQYLFTIQSFLFLHISTISKIITSLKKQTSESELKIVHRRSNFVWQVFVCSGSSVTL